MPVKVPGAVLRALLVVILVALPSLILRAGHGDTTAIVVLVAIFAALFTLVEYSAGSPSVLDFRDAPPFNRIRFAALFAMVFCLSMIFRGYQTPSDLTAVFQQSGAQIGAVIDFPYSPVRLMVMSMPDGADPALVMLMRDAAGLSYLISLLSIVLFIVLLRLRHWPPRGGAFNVWVNLPTFNPTIGGDVVARLQRDARVNIILGFLLPFLVPVALELLSAFGSSIDLASPHLLIWTVSAWAFLPASIVMRGVALSRVADMIAAQRSVLRDRVAAQDLSLS